MNHDLCVKMGEGILNIRVGAIIMKEDKFLMVENIPLVNGPLSRFSTN